MTASFTKAAVLEILRTPAASDTFPDMIRRVEALEGCGASLEDAYALGFEASGEGWNGEYPTADFRDDPVWQSYRDKNLAAELAAANAREAGLREALTPSGDTKAAYMGEVKDPETKRMVSWTAIKMVMAMISARAALAQAPAPTEEG